MQSSTPERIVLQDLTCPLVRLDKARRRDKSTGFFISVLLHALIFAIAGFSLIKPPQFGVDKGTSGIEVDLIAAPAEEPLPQESIITPVEEKTDFVEKEIPKPVVKSKPSPQSSQGKDAITAKSTGGAIVETKPNYLSNPAPAYPESARRRGYEGLVLLKTFLDKNGDPVKIEVEKSSGHAGLDEAALKAVKKWKFQPAYFGNIPVESLVHVPVRFEIESSR